MNDRFGWHRVWLKRKLTSKVFWGGLLAILFGVLIGWILHNYLPSQEHFSLSLREVGKYHYIAPLLVTRDNNLFRGASSLSSDISKEIRESKAAGTIEDASVYWRDLSSGRWMGVNEDTLYAPASMLKVALLISYLKEAEGNSKLLQQTVLFPGVQKTPAEIALDGPTILVPGTTYSIIELLQAMIINSDNEAKDLLQQYVSDNARTEIFSDLGLGIPNFFETGDIFSPKQFSLFFRILYNATYLSSELSEAALELLTHTTFTEGIVAGVPEGTVVAHKFGERVFVDSNNEPLGFELHDCGIVYHSNYPYFICIMTKGKNFNDLKSVIQNISKTAFGYVSEDSRPTSTSR